MTSPAADLWHLESTLPTAVAMPHLRVPASCGRSVDKEIGDHLGHRRAATISIDPK